MAKNCPGREILQAEIGNVPEREIGLSDFR